MKNLLLFFLATEEGNDTAKVEYESIGYQAGEGLH